MRTVGGAVLRLKRQRAGKRGAAGQGATRGWLPRLWLFSDPLRLPDPRAAAAALPRGAGVVARGVAPALLPALARQRRGRGPLLLGGDARGALRLRAGLHWPDRPAGSGLLAFLAARRAGAPWALLSCAAHGPAGLRRARRLGADLVFLSPAFPTPSHPGAPSLGPWRWAALARRAGRPVAALGGIVPGTAGRLPPPCCGLAAITALLRPGHSVSMKSRSSQAEHCPVQSA
ncbi:thiamine phosphate synthase [Pseudoroseomonas cervicalis]|uniref:thiamine phosphate synthase n=1 Tax=Teichococcus cervicalis TaxID=204525 RepID=UPI002788367A|nr:thiamine phosphate synthase [Pseudoroseomonas cervicalis]MDQ1081045.1 thiamine-phosphate pyrophosphorylase [Pseudoroseomonas cervicalis]